MMVTDGRKKTAAAGRHQKERIYGGTKVKFSTGAQWIHTENEFELVLNHLKNLMIPDNTGS